MSDSSRGCFGITRRGFVFGAASGLATAGPLGWMLSRYQMGQEQRSSFTGAPRELAKAVGMPGPFPGRVVEVRHPGSVNAAHEIQAEPVEQMVARGMNALTGSDDAKESWKRFFNRDDVVGIKVNPVGRKPTVGEVGRVRGAVGSISSPETIVAIVRSLKEYCGIPARNIIVFERYADEFRNTGYDRLMASRPMEGCKWYASSYAYDNEQLEIDGQRPGRGPRDPNVVGYDPDVFVSMGFCPPEKNHREDKKFRDFNSRDERRFRSHLSMIVTRMCSKIINIPCLKDHKSAGVTIALKNMSHGMNNNVCRSHLSGIYRINGSPTGPNQCNTFIPTAVAQRPLVEKMTLHIMDGLIGVYEGGPGCWNRTWGTWAHKGLFFATDPVAMDHVGWDIIDAKRAELGWAPVGHMGAIQTGRMWNVPPHLAALAAMSDPVSAAAILAQHQQRARGLSEPFERRQPEHVALAGILGLGVFDAGQIDHRVVNLG